MNNHVENALTASLLKFEKLASVQVANFKENLTRIFNLEANFLAKVASFDKLIDDNPKFEELREVYFDLLMINFFSEDTIKLADDYLESEEWLKIEDETIDRGTELLNLLLYINDCRDEQVKPSLGDFLKEFLLVEEDEFQDEFHIYEDLISNQQLAESSIEEICNHAGLVDLNEEMQALFIPFMAFFYQPDASSATEAELEKYSNNAIFDVVVYSLITNFNKI